jgi:hypothetical protein
MTKQIGSLPEANKTTFVRQWVQQGGKAMARGGILSRPTMVLGGEAGVPRVVDPVELQSPGLGRCWPRPRLAWATSSCPQAGTAAAAHRRPPSLGGVQADHGQPVRRQAVDSRAGARHRPRHLVRRLRGGTGGLHPRHGHRRTTGHPRNAPPRRGRRGRGGLVLQTLEGWDSPEIRAEFQDREADHGAWASPVYLGSRPITLAAPSRRRPGVSRYGDGPAVHGGGADGHDADRVGVHSQAGHRAAVGETAGAVRHRPHGDLASWSRPPTRAATAPPCRPARPAAVHHGRPDLPGHVPGHASRRRRCPDRSTR